MTLDGKVATRTGDSKWISGEESRLLSHHWRAERDAVVVGIGTALADDPQLNARIGGEPRQPRRVVFDSEGRLPLDSQLVRGAPELSLTVVVGRAASRLQTDALEVAGAEVIVATGENEPARVRSALDQLGAAGVTSILLEGGPEARGRVPRRRRGRRDPAVPRAGRGRRLERARPARGRGRGADRRGDPRARARRRADRRRRADLRAAEGMVMFTGLVQDLGRVTVVDATDDGVTLSVRTRLAGEIGEGDSVAVNGVCLTATAIADGEFQAEVMHETLRRSSLAEASAGSDVNLELSLRAADRLGGHICP